MVIPMVCAALVGLGLWLLVRGLATVPADAPPPRRRTWRPWQGWAVALAERLALADLALTPARFVLASLGLGLAAGLLVLGLTGLWLLALAGSLGSIWLLFTWLELRAGDRQRRIDLELEIAIGQMSGLIGEAGAGLTTTIEGLARRGPRALRPAFAEAGMVARADGVPAGVAALRRRLGPSAADLCEALALADAHGFERLTRLLPQLADNHREARRTRAIILALQHHALVQANALTAIPFLVIFIIRVTAPPDFSDVWQTPIGAVGLTTIVALVLTGRLLLRRLGRVAGLARTQTTAMPAPAVPPAAAGQGGMR